MQKENKKSDTIEKMVAEAILQDRKEVVLSGKKFKASVPTLATLIEASKYISELPSVKITGESPLFESLSIASDCEAIAKVVAVMILGGRKIKGLVYRLRFNWIERYIVNKATPVEINLALRVLLGGLQVEHFFAVTTSLIEVNLLKARREVDGKTSQTTASGQ